MVPGSGMQAVATPDRRGRRPCSRWLVPAALVHLAMASSVFGTTATIDVRLQSAINSYRCAPGSEFEAVVVSPYQVGEELFIPSGSMVRGRIRRVRSVGVGLVHERALLDLDFYEYRLADGTAVPFSAQVLAVDNAREEVTSDGRIKGILAGGGMGGLARGVWKTPTMSIFRRPLAGLTAIPGTGWTDYALGPAGMAGILVFRWVALRFPEPEIAFPRGTEMRLAVTSIRQGAPSFKPEEISDEPSWLAPMLAEVPYQTRKPGGRIADDIINVGFTGTREQLIRAFDAAGWHQAEPLNRRTFSRTYKAYIAMKGYPKAPVSKLLYQNREPDLVFEKSLNTVQQRHHVRIWQHQGRNLWLGAATHDIGIVFNVREKGLTHKIDRAIDKERSKLVNDLTVAGCVAESTTVYRRLPPTEGGTVTDGNLALLGIRKCDGPPVEEVSTVPKPGTTLSRFARRLALETRHYVLRDNAYNYGFRGILAFRRWMLLKPPVEE